MNIVFLTLPQDTEVYLRAKFSLDELDNTEAESILKQIMSHPQAANALEIASESDFFSLDRKQIKLIEVAKRCAIQNLAEESFLASGEEIQEDFFTYLTSDWEGIPAYTGALKRTTNKAQMLYIFELVHIKPEGIFHLPVQQPEEEPYLATRGITMSVVSKFLTKALKSAGAKIGGAVMEKLGAVIMNIVMKEVFGISDDPTRIINEIEKIVKREIVANEVSRVMGTIDGTMQYMSVEYFNRRKRADLSNLDTRKDLEQSVTRFSNKFYTDVIGLLRQEKYAEKGLKTFAIGATIHLLLTQELAIIDPNDTNPNESSYLDTLRSNARTYKAHVQSTYNRVMTARDNMEVFSERSRVSNGTRYITSTQWYWKDHYTGERKGPFMPTKNPDRNPQEHAISSLADHRIKVLAEKREELGNPKETFLSVIDGLINFSFPKS